VRTKSFIKHEVYWPEPKNARGINSYEDEWKAFIGPFQKAVDEKLFKALPYFIKGLNPRDRPRLLFDKLGRNRVMSTDFSSFEAHHIGEMAKVGVFWIMHMLRGVTFKSHFRRVLVRMFQGTNTSRFKHLTVSVAERLMSGAMWTSSANGVLNLLIMSFLNAKAKYPAASNEWLVENHELYFTGFVEGDDGICLDNDIPDSLITDLGINLTWERHPNFGTASFCGALCSLDDLVVIADPIKWLAKMTVAPPKYLHSSRNVKMSLVRALALSGLYQYRDCPVIGPICWSLCKRTSGFSIDRVTAEQDAWKRDLLVAANRRETWSTQPVVKPSVRDLVAEMFGVSVPDQLYLESLFIDPDENGIECEISHLLSVQQLRHRLDFVYKRENDINFANFFSSPLDPQHIVAQIMMNGKKPTVKHKPSLAIDRAYDQPTRPIPLELLETRPD